MAPTRVGIIGLSTAQKPGGAGAWAASTHLPSLQSLPEYEIVALANSTVESAKRSIAAHNLPATTKAYGSPEDIASDPEVDLVVVSVQVGKHYKLVKPALLQKKQVFVEWPLAVTMDEVEELAQLARDGDIATAVGVQSRAAPAVQKLKEIVSSGQLGRIISSTVVASTARIDTEKWPENLTYYLDASSGGNEYTIAFGHFLDAFVHVLGGLTDTQAILKTQYKTSQLVGSDGQLLNRTVQKTAPDHILVQGITEGGAVASIAFRKPKGPVDDTGIRWIITGTEGEASIVGDGWWQMMDKELKLQVKVGTEPTQTIDFDSYRVPAVEKVSPLAANVASLYDGFAKGDTTKYATFESAARTHRILERIKKAAIVQ
ncbi:transcription regulator gal80 [Purpureocillium takamizusanense]|uniref:Transcription regulator gal80 n=1 Tax=Purpureocillium takamizusanense TaxID=2060973 RepID=A0A9Q8VHG3_9HYPO|nr:transcription regulator gal80 [Purpureocillium takamizusanense]UNI24767.1 transcription regulator gal80 [Purpureocillium takamizusanense]